MGASIIIKKKTEESKNQRCKVTQLYLNDTKIDRLCRGENKIIMVNGHVIDEHPDKVTKKKSVYAGSIFRFLLAGQEAWDKTINLEQVKYEHVDINLKTDLLYMLPSPPPTCGLPLPAVTDSPQQDNNSAGIISWIACRYIVSNYFILFLSKLCNQDIPI